MYCNCRSLHRERGLKFLVSAISRLQLMSLPSQGAWIEIDLDVYYKRLEAVAPFTGSVD